MVVVYYGHYLWTNTPQSIAQNDLIKISVASVLVFNTIPELNGGSNSTSAVTFSKIKRYN